MRYGDDRDRQGHQGLRQRLPCRRRRVAHDRRRRVRRSRRPFGLRQVDAPSDARGSRGGDRRRGAHRRRRRERPCAAAPASLSSGLDQRQVITTMSRTRTDSGRRSDQQRRDTACHQAERGAEPCPRPHRAARRRRGDPVRAPADAPSCASRDSPFALHSTSSFAKGCSYAVTGAERSSASRRSRRS